MADNGRWFKLWTSSPDDPSLDNLDIADFGRWAKLGAVIKEHGERGCLVIESPARSLCAKMQVSTFDDLEKALLRLPNLTIERVNGKLTVTFNNWRKYQEDTTVSERVKKWRESKTVTGQEEKRGEEKRGEENKDIPVRKKRETGDPRVKEVIDYFHTQCQSVLGFAPAINGGQDGKRVLAALRVMPLPDVKKCIDFFLPSKKCKELGPTVSIALSAHSINLYKQGGTNGTRYDQLKAYFGISKPSGADGVHRRGYGLPGSDNRAQARPDGGTSLDGEAQEISEMEN